MTQSLLLSDPKQMVETLVLCLNGLIEECSLVESQTSIFDIKNKPTISFPNYLMRIFNYMGCSLPVYVYSLVIIDKIQEENPGFKITQKNIYRLLFTAIVIATKFIDDKYFKNKYYATVGGISLQQLNQQEQKMLELLNYHCPVGEGLFDTYLARLDQFAQNRIQEEVQPQATVKQEPLTPATQAESPRPKRRQIRQKRERSREKVHNRDYETQESREIDFY